MKGLPRTHSIATMSDIQEQEQEQILDVSEESEQMSTTSSRSSPVEKSDDQPEVQESVEDSEEDESTPPPVPKKAAVAVYEAPNESSTNEVSWFQPAYKMEEENLVLSYFNEDDVFRFRIEHNHSLRPLVGAVFKTVAGDELVSLNELTMPLDRFLAMSECWNSPQTQRVVLICDQNYVLENTTGQQVREAFIFLHKRRVDEDREDDATMCAVLAMMVILVGMLLALGAYLRFGGAAALQPPTV